MIKPLLSGTNLISEIHTAREKADASSFDVWWLGQSGFLILWNGKSLLLDPYLSDSLTKKYQDTDKPHSRMSEIVVDPSLLTGIDVVTSSHNHTDHLDAETLVPILRNNPSASFLIPEANRAFVCDRVQCDLARPTGLTDGEKVDLKGFTFYGVPAAHNTIERDGSNRCKFMGYVVQFGKWVIYHSGDTMWYDGIIETLKPFAPDIAFLPINGNDPARGVAGNLDAKEAVHLGIAIGARLVVPHHYDLFEFNTADPKIFARLAAEQHLTHRVLQLGERLNYC